MKGDNTTYEVVLGGGRGEKEEIQPESGQASRSELPNVVATSHI